MGERSGKDPQPDADVQHVEGPSMPGAGAVPAAEYASSMGNQAFGQALEAARGSGEQLARFPALFQAPTAPTAPTAPSVAGQAAQGAFDLGSRVRGAVESAAEAVVESAQGVTSAAIDKAALASRVQGIARDALTMWTSTSSIVGVTINGPSGFGGALLGAPLSGFMRAGSPPPPAEAAVQAKALQGFANAFQQWCAVFNVPGLPLWPGFAAFPGPQAPPMPGIPMPLAAFAPTPLPLTLVGADATEQDALDAAAAALRTTFDVWKGTKMVVGLLGMGPVPSFAPPYVPVGPVLHGTAFAPPPALI